MGHVDADVVGLVRVHRSPHLPEQLLVRDDFPGVPDERRQELVLDRRQAYFLLAHEHPAVEEIDLQLADLERRRVRFVGGAGGVPECHADPGEQLAGAERLAHVIVRAGVERRHLVALLAARGEHDDRDVRPLAEPPDHLEAVHVRQPEVHDDDVGLARAHLDDPVGARRRLEEPVPLARQRGAQEAPNLRLVLDQDDGRLRHRRARRPVVSR